MSRDRAVAAAAILAVTSSPVVIVALGIASACGAAQEEGAPSDESPNVSPPPPAVRGELPVCPEPERNSYDEGLGRFFLQVQTDRLLISGEDGTSRYYEYEGDDVPYEQLARYLREQRLVDEERRVIFVVSDPGVSESISERALSEAIAAGYDRSLRCRRGERSAAPIETESPRREALGLLGPMRGGNEPYEIPDRQPGVLDLGTPTVVGSMPVDAVQEVVARNAAAIRFCYEVALNQDPELTGRVEVRFTIDQLGRVTLAASASSTLDSEPAEGCMVRQVRRWRFPDSPGIVEVTYPFDFRPSPESPDP